jgi:hypothetical protein
MQQLLKDLSPPLPHNAAAGDGNYQQKQQD